MCKFSLKKNKNSFILIFVYLRMSIDTHTLTFIVYENSANKTQSKVKNSSIKEHGISGVVNVRTYHVYETLFNIDFKYVLLQI